MALVRNAIDKSLAERDANVDKFCVSLDKDIAVLGKEVKQVKQEAQVKGGLLIILYQYSVQNSTIKQGMMTKLTFRIILLLRKKLICFYISISNTGFM